MGETQKTKGGGASLSAVESQEDSAGWEYLAPVFVEAIEIQLVVGKLTCPLPVLIRGGVLMWTKCSWQSRL